MVIAVPCGLRIAGVSLFKVRLIVLVSFFHWFPQLGCHYMRAIARGCKSA